ncbi:PXA domain-containing protein [Amylostereum chailletii]|nr:PXA domain-containing protein [Amylostereum chailletii]
MLPPASPPPAIHPSSMSARARSLASSTLSRPSPPHPASAPQSISLTKRLLFPHLPPTSPVPPLLADPAASAALDAELYDFIALALRAFVNPWWTKITRYDKDFLPHITRILTTVIRTLEARASTLDLSPLIYHHLPLVLNQHFLDYRVSSRKLGSSYAAAGATTLPALFHAQQQHLGVTPDGCLDEVYIRTAIDAVLKVCLPPEDWESQPERHIIREVIVMVICKSVAPKITQGWFVHKSILDLIGRPEDIVEPSNPVSTDATSSTYKSSSVHTLLVFFLSTVQRLSSAALTFANAYKQARQTTKLVNASPWASQSVSLLSSQPFSLPLAGEMTELNPPSQPKSSAEPLSKTPSLPSPASSVVISTHPATPNLTPATTPLRDLAFAPLLFLTTALDLSSRFASSAFVMLLSMIIALLSPFLDRLLPYILYKDVLAPHRLVGIVSAAKRALFPNGYPAQAPPDPTSEEQLAIRSMLIARITSGIPSWIAPILLGPPAARSQTLDGLLDPLSDPACNTHLFVLILDQVLLALFPEMGVGGGEVLTVDVLASRQSSVDSRKDTS